MSSTARRAYPAKGCPSGQGASRAKGVPVFRRGLSVPQRNSARRAARSHRGRYLDFLNLKCQPVGHQSYISWVPVGRSEGAHHPDKWLKLRQTRPQVFEASDLLLHRLRRLLNFGIACGCRLSLLILSTSGCVAIAYCPTSHQSGQRTFEGVRVASATTCCSSSVSRRSPSRARAASTSQGSSTIRAVSR